MGDIDIYPSPTSSSPLSGSFLAYSARTSGLASAGVETDIPELTVTVTVPVGRRLRISAVALMTTTASYSNAGLRIKEGTTQLAEGSLSTEAGSDAILVTPIAIISPSAGLHTYKVSGFSKAGGAWNIVADSTKPAFILVEDITGNQNIAPVYSVPVGVLVQATSAISVNSIGSTAVTLLSVNFAVAAGRTLKVTAGANLNIGTVGGRALGSMILDGTAIGRWVDRTTSSAGYYHSASDSVLFSPSAGAHTLTMSIACLGVGTLAAEADTTEPIHLFVEDVTPTPASGQGAPGSTLAYAKFAGTGITLASGTYHAPSSVTFTVPAGRRIRVSAQSQVVTDAEAGWFIDVREDTSSIGRIFTNQFPGASKYDNLSGSVVVSPSAGTHTYKLYVERFSGTGSFGFDAVGETPYILVEDITAAEWPTITAVTTGAILQQAAEPSSPVLNDIWLDTDESSGVGLSSILAYAEAAASVTAFSAETEIAQVTFTVPEGRRIRVSARAEFTITNADVWVAGDIRVSVVGGTGIAQGTSSSMNASQQDTMSIDGVISPAAGTHTWIFTMRRVAGTGTITAHSAANTRAFILVEDITGTLWPAGQSIGAGTIASEAWTPWVPTFTNFTLGNGTLVARYSKIGRTVTCYLSVIFGSSSSFSGGLTFTPPVLSSPTAYPAAINHYWGSFWCTNVSSVVHLGWLQFNPVTGIILPRVARTDGTWTGFNDLTATTPFTWVTGNYFSTTFTYEAAS